MSYFCSDFRIETLYFIRNYIPIEKARFALKSLFPFIFIFSLFFAQGQEQDEAAIKAGKSLFNANCAACHKLNKRAVGPALRGVSEKYDREWLYQWINNSTAMAKTGDPDAVAVNEENNK